jgi:thioredoxin-like negative regulator of GroEL
MQLIEVRRVSRRRKSARYLIALAILAVAIVGWMAIEPARVRYHAWKRQHALTQAKGFIEKHDVANTQVALDVALHAGPADPDTIRVAADMLEQVNAPQAMRLRRDVVRLAPESASDIAALVYSCMHFRDFNAAKDALHTAPPAVASQPAAMRAALAYALATNDSPMADFILRQLRATSPNDDGLAYTHAVLRLKMPRPADREAAARELETLVLKEPKLRTNVERELAGAAIARRDYGEARIHLTRVLASPEVTLGDRLQSANLDLLVDHRPFNEVFATLSTAGAANEQSAAMLLQWLVVQGRVDDAADWAARLPAAVHDAPAVLRMEADIFARKRDWDRLSPLLKNGVWGPIPADTLRFLNAAQTVDSPDKPNLRQDVWDMALNSTAGNLAGLRTLLRLAAAWQWTTETERTEWAIVRAFPDQTWAFQDLFNTYKSKKDTGGMREVLSRLHESDPAVARYRYDYALLTLLTSPTQNWDGSKIILEELYRTSPSDASYATGYAFALAQADRGKEAAAVLAKMSEEDRIFPPRLPYLAYVYGVARMKPEFERVNKPNLDDEYLPEERQLFLQGRDALTRVVEKPTPAPANGSTKQ